MDIDELRKIRVQSLIDECGSVKAFAERVGIPPGQASHLKTGFRNVGKTMARRIETAFEKDRGWMDSPLPNEFKGYSYIPVSAATSKTELISEGMPAIPENGYYSLTLPDIKSAMATRNLDELILLLQDLAHLIQQKSGQ